MIKHQMTNKGNEKNLMDCDDQPEAAMDETISCLVRRVKAPLPLSVEMETGRMIQKAQRKKHRFLSWFQRFRWASLVVGATALALIILVFYPFNREQAAPATPLPESGVSEIKTELTLTEYNIKIIWVQKKEFHLDPA